MGFESQEVERKVISILNVLGKQREPLGARVIARRLKDHGVELSERAVRYHLKLMDERGLTKPVGKDGRLLTEQGIEETRNALARDKMGFALSRIEALAFRTSFDWEKCSGLVPVNISLFPSESFKKAFRAMKEAFAAELCVSELVAVASEGGKLGEVMIPQGKIGFATVCSIIINGSLLKAGIPLESRFGGILQIRDHKPTRFVDFIHYAGSTLDPSEVFIKARMTSVGEMVSSGGGKIVANYREIPAPCRSMTDEIVARLKEAGLGGLIVMGEPSQPVCEIPIALNRVGMVLMGGLNPVAAAEERGIEAENMSMSTVMEYRDLVNFKEAWSE
jgi:repressor of nif and glnA expression